MRLTKAIREAFISAVEAGLPRIEDFDAETHFRKPIREVSRSFLPQAVQDVMREYPGYIAEYRIECIRPSDWKKDEYFYYRASFAPTLRDNEPSQTAAIANISRLATEKLDAWCVVYRDRLALLNRLREVANAASTDSALASALPEFAHLIPTEKKPSAIVPIGVGTLVADLKKAGWKEE